MNAFNDPVSSEKHVSVSDPRLTAYALGEMNSQEQADFEAELASNSAAAQELEGLKLVANELESMLGGAGPLEERDLGSTLSSVQRESLLAEISSVPTKADSTWTWVPMVAAAALVMLVSATAMLAKREAASPRMEARESVFGQLHNVSSNETTASSSAAPTPVLRSFSPFLAPIDFSDRGGGGLAGAAALPPSAGAYFNDGTDGNFGTRTKQVIVPPASGGVETIPAEYGTRTKAVLVRPATTRQIPIPAEFGLVQERVMVRPATSRRIPIPAEFGLVQERVMVRPATTRQIPIPAEYAQRQVLVRPGPNGQQVVVAELQSTNGKSVWVRQPEQTLKLEYSEPVDVERYVPIPELPFMNTRTDHTSTFSIDIDTASYSNVRRFLKDGNPPPADAVRVEEMVNYFDYGYEAPTSEHAHPFKAHTQIATCPWNPTHRLARIALKGREIEMAARPSSNLVFLVDVSGSMSDANKLPLVKQSLAMLVEQLDERDRIAVVTYASSSEVVLEPTTCTDKAKILSAINSLTPGGSTNGAAGIETAYAKAAATFITGGTNRVVLVTDGDFNVGATSSSDLVRIVECGAKVKKIFLSILGYGMGNYQDGRMETLSNKGQGNYAYIDSLDEARRVLVEKLTGTLMTIAKDVKIQVFFNPQKVASYRLLGYQNRTMAAKDFNNDRKDAGEVGAGHEVTALYEIVPVGVTAPSKVVDDNPFVTVQGGNTAPSRQPAKTERAPARPESFRLRVRYKQPEGDTSTLYEHDVTDTGTTFAQTDRAFQWAASVASFGQILRRSSFRGNQSLGGVLETTNALVESASKGATSKDTSLRSDVSALSEFVELVRAAQRLEAGR